MCLKCTDMQKVHDDLDDRFELRLGQDTRARLDVLASKTGLTKSEVVRRLIWNANPREIRDDEQFARN